MNEGAISFCAKCSQPLRYNTIIKFLACEDSCPENGKNINQRIEGGALLKKKIESYVAWEPIPGGN